MSRNIDKPGITAPALILDLLVSGGEALGAKDFARAGTLVGLSASTVRVGLNRLVGQGKIQHTARGTYALIEDEDALTGMLARWHARSRAVVEWRNAWVGVLDADVLRSDKRAWRHHGLALSLFGFKRLRSGLAIRPDNLRGGVPELRNQMLPLGLSTSAVVCRLDTLSPQHEDEGRQLWKAAQLDSVDRFWFQRLKASAAHIRLLDPERAALEALITGRAVIAHLMRDPLLPEQMRPSRSRAKLVEEALGYQKDARLLWRTWLDQVSGSGEGSS
ncbi:PaaX family transcriptional regulator [Pseudomonas gingeri]|uniref:PaaX family transcriptional regulator n=1 Tax=Pseudomonas gingeri TaxID=117681 RepID=UPI00159FFA92|nr:PaaX family transcriptional regulator [Pseudomonas gingeri]NWD66886.1 PaaX family transcriptional regulator [Pseudomonas gingeri]